MIPDPCIRVEKYICTFLFFPRSTRDRITIVRYTWDCFAGSFLLLGSSWIFNRWSIKEERGRKNVTSSAHRPHCAWRNAKRGQSTPPWQVAARSDINAADHDQLRYVSIIKFRSLHCRRHSSVRRLIWRLYPRFFLFFLPRERSNTILRYTADISKYIAGWDRSGRVPLEGENSRARCKSYLSLDTHTCWLCSLEISSCLITVVTGDNPISCSIARKVENYTYNS